MKVAISHGDPRYLHPVKLGEGIVGHAALHKEVVLVPDVSKDPRYIQAVEDVRSELVVPLLLKDRCVGVFDLESPELDAFSKKHVELLELLASQAAVAIENARLYEALRDNEVRLEKEVRFAQRVQLALLPRELPKRLKGVDVAWQFNAARELGGDVYDFLSPDPNSFVVAVGDVSGKGVPAALYSAFVGELIRGRAFRARLAPERSGPAEVLASMNRILHERQLEEYYCTLCYALFDLKRRKVTLSNSGLPFPIYSSGGKCAQIQMPGVPLGSFAASSYDETVIELQPGDVLVFCSDGIFEAWNRAGEEFGAARLLDIVDRSRQQTAKEIVAAIVDAVSKFRGDASQTDDQTAVVVKIAQ
jgi:sigma-B regulation protein RsbU (phosphoserine phosphatase)